MQDNLQELIEATHQLTNIARGFIEKDYYVVHVLTILSSIKNDYFKLVFAGGTCLAKAHKITHRMSEDLDFKLQPHHALSTKLQRKEFSQLRQKIITALEKEGFICDAKPTEGRNTHVEMHIRYPTLFQNEPGIRPYILLELTIANIKLQPSELLISTLIESVLGNKFGLRNCRLTCSSIEETAVEKWVALTRRVAEADRYPRKSDGVQTLVRHVYDLFIISEKDKLGNNFLALAEELINSDKEKLKKNYVEYFSDPINEIKHSLDLLKTEKYKTFYRAFVESLVYDGALIPSYEDALYLVKRIGLQVIHSFGKISTSDLSDEEKILA